MLFLFCIVPHCMTWKIALGILACSASWKADMVLTDSWAAVLSSKEEELLVFEERGLELEDNVPIPASHRISAHLQGNCASPLWPCCFICKIKEECFPATCFLGVWARRATSGREYSGSAKLEVFLQYIHNLFVQHQFFMYNLFWGLQVWFSLSLHEAFNKCKWPTGIPPPPPFFFCKLFSSSTYSPNYHAAKRDSEPALGDLAGLENERQIYKSVLEGGDIPFQGLSGLKRPSSSASTKGRLSGHGPDLHSVQCVKSVVIWGKVLQGLQSCPSQLRVPLSFLFAISSFLSFLPQSTQISIFHDAFTWSRFLIPAGTSSLCPAPPPHLHVPLGCSIWPCCPSAPCIVMLQPFPAFSALPTGSISRPQHVCWPRCPGGSWHHVLHSLLPEGCAENAQDIEPAVSCGLWGSKAAETSVFTSPFLPPLWTL